MSSALEAFKNHKKLLEEELKKEVKKEETLRIKIQEAEEKLRRAEQSIKEREPRKHKLTDDIEDVEALTESALSRLTELEETAKDFARENTYIFGQGEKEIKQLEHRLKTLTSNYETKNSKIKTLTVRVNTVEPRLKEAEERLEKALAKERILERKLEGGKYKLRVSDQLRESAKRKERKNEETIVDLQWRINLAQVRFDMAITRIDQLEEVIQLKENNLAYLKKLRERTFKENFIRRQKLVYMRNNYYQY